MTFAMLRTVPPAGRFLYGDIALLSEDEDENGSEGSGSEEHTTTSSTSFCLSSSSQSAFHIKVNRKRKMCGGGGLGIASIGARLGPTGSSPPGEIRQRTAANARERDRTNSVNTAFTALRTLIPTEPADRYTFFAFWSCASQLCLIREKKCSYTHFLWTISNICLFLIAGSYRRLRRYAWPAATSVIWATCCFWARGFMTDNRVTRPRHHSSTLAPPPVKDPTSHLSPSTSVPSVSATRGKWWAGKLHVGPKSVKKGKRKTMFYIKPCHKSFWLFRSDFTLKVENRTVTTQWWFGLVLR